MSISLKKAVNRPKKENYDILSLIYDSEAMSTKLSTVRIVLIEKNLIILENSGAK